MLKRPAHCLFLALGLGLLGHAALATTHASWWQQFELRNLAGAPVAPDGRWHVVVFLSPECPVANVYVPVLNGLAAEFSPRGFSFVGVYADPTIPPSALRQHVKDYHIAFATADDRAHRLVRAIGAGYTPEVFVFTRDGALLYRGRIDDRVEDFGVARPAATREELREVLAALAAGKPGPFENHRGFGCSIPEHVK